VLVQEALGAQNMVELFVIVGWKNDDPF